jgi:hypothetical protein
MPPTHTDPSCIHAAFGDTSHAVIFVPPAHTDPSTTLGMTRLRSLGLIRIERTWPGGLSPPLL